MNAPFVIVFESLLALISLIINNLSPTSLITGNKKAMSLKLLNMAVTQWGNKLKGINKINHVLR